MKRIRVYGDKKFNPLDFEMIQETLLVADGLWTLNNILELLKANTSYGLSVLHNDEIGFMQLGDW